MAEIPSERRARERAERKASRGARRYFRGNRRTRSQKARLVEIGFAKAQALRTQVVAEAQDRIADERAERVLRRVRRGY